MKKAKDKERIRGWRRRGLECVSTSTPFPCMDPATTFVTLPGTKKISSFGRGDKKSIPPFPVVLFLGICPLPPNLPPPKIMKAQKIGGKLPILAHRKIEEKQKIMGNQMCRHRSLPLFSPVRICLSVLYVTLILIKEMENWFFCSLWAQKVGFSGNGGCSVRLSSVRNLFRLLLTVKVFWSFGRGGGSKLEANIYLSKNIPSALNSFFC